MDSRSSLRMPSKGVVQGYWNLLVLGRAPDSSLLSCLREVYGCFSCRLRMSVLSQHASRSYPRMGHASLSILFTENLKDAL